MCLVYVWPFSTPWTVARQASLSVGILQERTLEWVAISFSRGSSRPRNWTRSPTLQADSWPSEPPGKPFRAMKACYLKCYGDTQEHCSQISLSYLPLFLPYPWVFKWQIISLPFLFDWPNLGFPGGSDSSLPRVWYLSQEDSWRREWQPTPVFLPGEFHGERSLVGCSPQGHKESGTTEGLIHKH